jgi:hypothetical protein
MVLGRANKASDKIPPGPKLDAFIAEKVFGWKNLHNHEGSLVAFFTFLNRSVTVG